ncbi:unnamed protein product [Amaranthus hypochondriacus]
MDNQRDMMEEELKRGWEAATQLRSLILDNNNVPISQLQTLFNQTSSSSSDPDHDDDQTMEIQVKNYSNTVLHSFQNSISIIKNMIQSMEIMQPSSAAQTSKLGSPPKNRRYIIETSNLSTSDGYTWRKYGQKSIYNTTHPREYFRCVYKEDQKCQATKHVQKISDSPTKYRITYFADHTCQPNLVKNTNISDFNVLEIPGNDYTNYISFESQNSRYVPKEAFNHPNNYLNSTPSFSTTINPHHPPLESLDHMAATMTTTTTTTTMESLETDIAVNFNPELDVVFSPRPFISPNYMDSSNIETTIDYSLMTIEPYFDFDNCALNDFPIWN